MGSQRDFTWALGSMMLSRGKKRAGRRLSLHRYDFSEKRMKKGGFDVVNLLDHNDRRSSLIRDKSVLITVSYIKSMSPAGFVISETS